MKYTDGKWRISSRDIWRSSCSHCVQLAMAVAVGHPEAIAKTAPFKQDVSGLFQVVLGTEFEALLIEQLQANLPAGELLVLQGFDPQTANDALQAGPMVIAQPYFRFELNGVEFTGFADLLVRQDVQLALLEDGTFGVEPSGAPLAPAGPAKYSVWDIKHSKEPKANYFQQVGGYAYALEQLGVLADEPSGLVLKARNLASQQPQELKQAFLEAATPLVQKLNQGIDALNLDTVPLEWHCPVQSVCNNVRCEYPDLCAHDRVELNMLNQVYNMNFRHEPKLVAAGYTTVECLANTGNGTNNVPIDPTAFHIYQAWARLIQAQRQTGVPQLALWNSAEKVRNSIPQPNEHDLFFDLEWYGAAGAATDFNYVFGLTDSQDNDLSIVALTQDQEKFAFQKFMTFATDHVMQHIGARIYHYSNPETLRLKKLAAKYGMQDQLELLLPKMVDLLPVVRKNLATGFGGLGIKVMENFYQDGIHDQGGLRGNTEVTDGEDSQLKFHNYLGLLAAGKTQQAQAELDGILKYNVADCVSTRLLRDWLLTGLDDVPVISKSNCCELCGAKLVKALYGMVAGDPGPGYRIMGCMLDEGADWPPRPPSMVEQEMVCPTC